MLSSNAYLFTSESVSEGHPDKIADQISDAVLDAILQQDKDCRVACETLVKTGMVLVAGEITTNAWVNIEQIARNVIKSIGYDNSEMGFDWESCAILTAIGKQSSDLELAIIKNKNHDQAAGDQGLVFGYATNETDVFMPAPIIYSHRLMQRHACVRKNGVLPWLRPDAKCQLTFMYENDKPIYLDSVVISTQHCPSIELSELKEGVMEEIIKPVLPEKWINKKSNFLINPGGRFVIGGPLGDCGLTGRKIIVDSYGGTARHGGGCFSGKDPSKIDRSAAYAARYIAKNIIASGIAERCEIQIAYAIGIASPVSLTVNTFGTSKIDDNSIANMIPKFFDLKPRGIINMLNLQAPIYLNTAAYGHFGRTEPSFTWEKIDKAYEISKLFITKKMEVSECSVQHAISL